MLCLLNNYHCLGTWTVIRNEASNDNLAAKGFEHGLNLCVILNPGTLQVSKGLMATTVEAILGAVELDGGPGALLQVATHLGLVHPLINLVKSQNYFLHPRLNELYLQLTCITSSALPLTILCSSTLCS